MHLGIHDRQLRYFDVQGQLVPTLQELIVWKFSVQNESASGQMHWR
jgi:hypothetical protein